MEMRAFVVVGLASHQTGQATAVAPPLCYPRGPRQEARQQTQAHLGRQVGVFALPINGSQAHCAWVFGETPHGEEKIHSQAGTGGQDVGQASFQTPG